MMCIQVFLIEKQECIPQFGRLKLLPSVKEFLSLITVMVKYGSQ